MQDVHFDFLNADQQFHDLNHGGLLCARIGRSSSDRAMQALSVEDPVPMWGYRGR
jgi:hypothetical protein